MQRNVRIFPTKLQSSPQQKERKNKNKNHPPPVCLHKFVQMVRGGSLFMKTDKTTRKERTKPKWKREILRAMPEIAFCHIHIINVNIIKNITAPHNAKENGVNGGGGIYERGEESLRASEMVFSIPGGPSNTI